MVQGIGGIMKKTAIFTAALATALCSSPATGVPEAAKPAVSAQSASMSESIAESEMQLFKNIYEKGSNTVISPYSIGTVMNMALCGADGRTEKEMRKALKIPASKDREAILKESKSLIDSISSDSFLTIESANSIWAKDEINRKYSEECSKYFNAEARMLKSAEEINRWCSDKTHGKIKKIINSASGIDVALINAVYFNGTWQTPFKKSMTRKESFRKSDGSSMIASMMHEKTGVAYFENDSFKMISMPYKGRSASMLVLLPSEGTDIKRFVSKITSKKITDAIDESSFEEVNIAIPKFKTEYEKELSSGFKKMGIRSAFGYAADFSRIAPGLRISRILHKTYIDVNEQGTEAAAVTAAMMTKCMMPRKPKEFRADRPFMFVIMDTESNMPLFEGVIENPEYR